MIFNEKNGEIIPTELTRKIVIDGHTEVLQVYKVRIDKLYYNDQNDRIATWMSKYKEENDVANFEVKSEKYNKIVENFIKESNPKAIEKTKNNIGIVGQREAGVILADGRIIDGNRRYTCLRMLNDERINEGFNYFETVILDRDMDQNRKAIKLLELEIQHGEEGKTDYNPIDKLVGLYNDVVKDELLTVEEYAKSIDESIANVKKRIVQSELMVEFLSFINADNKFYIARDLELDGPLGEIASILKKVKTEEEREDLKLVIFTNLLMKPQGDMTRFIRKMNQIANSEYLDEYIDEQMNFVEEAANLTSQSDKVSTQYINKIVRGNDDLKDKMKVSLEKAELKAKKKLTMSMPLTQVQKSTMLIESVDKLMIPRLSESEKNQLKQALQTCKEELEQLESLIE